MVRISLTVLSILAIWSTTGCASIQDMHYKCAHKTSAYCSSLMSPEVPLFDGDFKEGWRQAYYDFSTGRTCSPPKMPPKKYWAPSYQNCKGQEAIANWYRGYEMGLVAAEKKNGGSYHVLRPYLPPVPQVQEGDFLPLPFENNPATPEKLPPQPQEEPIPADVSRPAFDPPPISLPESRSL